MPSQGTSYEAYDPRKMIESCYDGKMHLRKVTLMGGLLLWICLGTALAGSALLGEDKPVGGPQLSLTDTPVEVVQRLKLAHAKTQSACVACFMGGSAAAVVISEEGLVATAGHVINPAKPKEGEERLATLTFFDGTEWKAKPLGCNLENDIGLFQIVPHEGEDSLPEFSYAEIADRAVQLGDFCYLWSHPAGKKEGRPAQLRLGRITQIQKDEGRPWMYYSDLMIQPGDSGAGVFSLDGKLIAIASTAGSIPRLNRFMAIDRLADDRERMQSGERFGDFEMGPGGKKWSQVSVPANKLSAVTALFQKRVQQRDRYILEFIRREAKGGKLEMNPSTLAGVMVPEVFALAEGDSVSDGLEDPRLLAALPFPEQDKLLAPPRLFSGNAPLSAVATRVKDRWFITKASEVTGDEGEGLPDLAVQVAPGKGVRLVLMKVFEEHDLAVLKLPDPAATTEFDGPSVEFASTLPPLLQGSGLMAIDPHGQRTWGIACDEARPVPKRISKGPVDEFRISEKRAGFPSAISHNLPLFAADVGTPVYDFEGRFAGIHLARHSRTLGLILPADVIQGCLREVIEGDSGN